MQAASEGTVTISLERFKKLEAYEARDRQKLERLRKYQMENPKEHSQKVLNNYYKNKESINEKRRAAYKAKKEAEAAAKNEQANSTS